MNGPVSDLLRAADKDRWLACLLAPQDAQAHLMALYAFNFEVARVRETVSEPGLGEIRLQFWADAVEGIFAGQVPEHPVAEALARAVEKGGLGKASLLNLIEARRFDLYDDPMPDMATLEGYLGETASILFQMAAHVLAGPAARNCAEAAGLGGVAYGLAGLMRAYPIHCRRGQLYVPGDVLARHGVTPAQARSARIDGGMQAVMAQLREHARQRLQQARASLAQAPREALPGFLPLALVDGWLKGLERGREPSQLAKQWKLWRAAARGRV